jgi:hypothetical protein
MSDDIVSKADSFINRRRAQGGTSLQDNENEDIPVLTDIVPEQGPATKASLSASLKQVEIVQELEDWLDKNLPLVVTHALDGIADKLIAQIHQNAREDLLPRLQKALGDNTRPE